MSSYYPPNSQNPYGQGGNNPFGTGPTNSYSPNSPANAYGAWSNNPQDPYGQGPTNPNPQGPAAYGPNPYQPGYPAAMPPPGMPVTAPPPPKKSNTWIIWLIVGLIVLTLLIAIAVALGRAMTRSGPDEAVPASRAGYTPPPGAKAIGDTATAKDHSGTATVKILSATWRTTAVSGGHKPFNDRYLVLNVEYQGQTGKYHYGATDWSLQGKDNKDYVSTPSSEAKPELRIGTLTSGQTARGYVSFDLPQGDAILKLDQTPSEAPIKFGVPSPK